MINRFMGTSGQRLRFEALLGQKMVAGNQALAGELVDIVEMMHLNAGDVLIEQNASDNHVYFIFAGAFDIVVNGKVMGKRSPGNQVGEMAAVEPTQKRSASVIASEESVVAKLTEPAFAEFGSRYPELYRQIAKELSRRLLQRNSLVSSTHDKIRVFIISSVESLPIARSIQNAFEHDPFLVTVWTDGVFKVSNYTLQSLEDAVDQSDFAIAIAHSDDLTKIRGLEWPTPRDNVVFELGLFMGRLGRARAILMEPREEKVKLPSDLAGVTSIAYRHGDVKDMASLLAPACNQLRDYINKLGPNN
jgi:predicted nucleotide-binding protein